ncbi:uncharacterized protein BDV14DRAFT_193916 [Aspergillus stella-maris]|uniref:uncharacterized protein n=1 Tax=Aspergillus stella-maris TaxID=1810926 RepID=UPI003CCE5015
MDVLPLGGCSKQDLCSLCLISHSFNAIATPILYRSINLIEPDRDPFFNLWGRPEEKAQRAKKARGRRQWLLLSRLEDEANETLRNLVQEVNLSVSKDSGDADFIDHLTKDSRLCNLLNKLSNLRHIINTISNHTRKPSLSLSLRNIEKALETISFREEPLACLTDLTATINPYYDRTGPNKVMLQVQDLFFNSPNLRTFSLSVSGNYGRCMNDRPRFSNVTSFRLLGAEKFPPLNDLRLDGYRINDAEWYYWQQGLDWGRLSSLTIGPQNAFGTLKRLVGYVTSLKTLRVYRYPNLRWRGEGSDPVAMELEELLKSLDGLEELEVRGVPVSVEVVGLHKGSKKLCLHEEETASEGNQRNLLTLDEVKHIKKCCQKLRDLKVKIKIGDSEMNEDLFYELATSFPQLGSLSLHFEIGLKKVFIRSIPSGPTCLRLNPSDEDTPATLPPLTTTTALSIGKRFFDIRREADIEITPWFTLTLWTGNYIRCWGQLEPKLVNLEKLLTSTFEISVPNLQSGEVQMRHLEKEELDMHTSRKKDSGGSCRFRIQDLAKRVRAVSGENEAIRDL